MILTFFEINLNKSHMLSLMSNSLFLFVIPHLLRMCGHLFSNVLDAALHCSIVLSMSLLFMIRETAHHPQVAAFDGAVPATKINSILPGTVTLISNIIICIYSHMHAY